MFWGLTPALNFLDEYELNHLAALPDELNILLIGAGDCRHILLTCARRYRYKKVKLNFYIIEACMETAAKQLLLLLVALQPSKVLGLEQKTKIFMELYGNALVRPSIAKYLSATASEMVKMLTDYQYLNKIFHERVKFDIKYKERDYLENLLKFWCSKDEFNICDSWDKRLRKHLGVRYDSKIGAFDWDLHMTLHNLGAIQICSQEYRSFRLNGVAFTWLESEVSKPNRSLACAIIPNGESFAHYGYLGDIQTGPFISFGLDCEDKKFLKSTNGQNSYRSTDITERNLKQILHELEHQSEYEHNFTTDRQLGLVQLKEEKLVVDVKAVVQVVAKPAEACVDLENVQVNFLSIRMLDMMKYKEKFKSCFNVLYFGASYYLKYLQEDLVGHIARNSAMLMIEVPRYVLCNRKEQLEEFGKGVEEKVGGMDCKRVGGFEVLKDDYARFILKSNKEAL